MTVVSVASAILAPILLVIFAGWYMFADSTSLTRYHAPARYSVPGELPPLWQASFIGFVERTAFFPSIVVSMALFIRWVQGEQDLLSGLYHHQPLILHAYTLVLTALLARDLWRRRRSGTPRNTVRQRINTGSDR